MIWEYFAIGLAIGFVAGTLFEDWCNRKIGKGRP